MKKIKRKAGHAEQIMQKTLRRHRETLLGELLTVRANHARYIRQFKDMERRKSQLLLLPSDEEHKQLLAEIEATMERTRRGWEDSIHGLRATREDNIEFLKELDLLDEFDDLLDDARLE